MENLSCVLYVVCNLHLCLREAAKKLSFFTGPPTKWGGGEGPFLKTFFNFLFCSQSKIKHILFKVFFIGGYLWLPRYKITSKYGSFSPNFFSIKKRAIFRRHFLSR